MFRGAFVIWYELGIVTSAVNVAKQICRRFLFAWFYMLLLWNMHGNTADCVISYLMCMLFLLLEKYFDMKKNQCKEGLDIYKKFLTRMTRISEFLKVAEVKTMFSQTLPSIWKSWFSHKPNTASFQLNFIPVIWQSLSLWSDHLRTLLEKPDCKVLVDLHIFLKQKINEYFKTSLVS